MGLWSYKEEAVNGYDCKVYSVNDIEIVMRTRTEHLSPEDKKKAEESAPLLVHSGFFGFTSYKENASDKPYDSNAETPGLINPLRITPEQYFDPDFDLEKRDIGNPRKVSVLVRKFKANLWLCENYPLSFQEQILPIIDLLAIIYTRFAKLREFINLKLPSGFPVKLGKPKKYQAMSPMVLCLYLSLTVFFSFPVIANQLMFTYLPTQKFLYSMF